MKSIIISAGKYAEVYLVYLKEQGVEVVGFVDDCKELQGKFVLGLPVLGKVSDLKVIRENLGVEAVYCPLGNNVQRVKFLTYARSVGLQTPNFIHSSVILSPEVRLGEGVYILLGAKIMPFACLENDVMISMNACVAHHSILKSGTFLSTGVNFGASIIAEKNAYIGIGATIMTGVKRLGSNCLVGAGAVVIRDVEDNAIVAGVPAKFLKYRT